VSRLSRVARSHWRTALGAVLGAAGGAAYAHFVGCHTGTCPLTSNVWTAGLFFGFTGALVGAPGGGRGRPAAGRAASGSPDRLARETGDASASYRPPSPSR
jgi:hypothetical protein